MKSTIIWDKTACGKAPRSRYFDDRYFNSDGAIAETNYVFIEGNQLWERFKTSDHFVVAETGFGSGLNFLLLWQLFLQFRQQYPHHPLQKLQFYSVEKYPLSKQELSDIHYELMQTVDANSSLQSLVAQLQAKLYPNQHQDDVEKITCSLGNVELTILFDDVMQFPAFLRQQFENQHIVENMAQSDHQNGFIDAWFFDGFSPQKNPDMWSLPLFKHCYELTREQGTFATFSAAGFVRRNLQEAGFTVNKRKGYGVKREMLVGKKE